MAKLITLVGIGILLVITAAIWIVDGTGILYYETLCCSLLCMFWVERMHSRSLRAELDNTMTVLAECCETLSGVFDKGIAVPVNVGVETEDGHDVMAAGFGELDHD